MYNNNRKYTSRDYKEYSFTCLASNGRWLRKQVVSTGRFNTHTGKVSATSERSARYKVRLLLQTKVGDPVCIRDLQLTVLLD